jgi:hypothetical protein
LFGVEARFRHQSAKNRGLTQTPRAILGELPEAVQIHGAEFKFKVQGSKFKVQTGEL